MPLEVVGADSSSAARPDQGAATEPPVTAGIRRSATESSGGPSTKRPTTIKDVFLSAQSYAEGGSRASQLNDALAFMVCKDKMPLSTSERTGFLHFAKVAVPRWVPPSRPTLTRMIDHKYEVLSKKYKEMIAQSENYSLTCDTWSDNHMKSHLGVTLHFLSGEEMRSLVIGLVALDESHTADYIGGKLEDMCSEWNIQKEKLKMAVTDNAENMKKAVSDLFGSGKHVPCFPHTLNLIPSDALKIDTDKATGNQTERVPGYPSLIKRVREIVSYVRHSINASDELRRVQFLAGKTEGTALKLIHVVPTRWNSSFLMVQRFLELSDSVTLVLLKHPKGPAMLSGTELESLRAICKILKPLLQVTEELSAEKVPAGSKVIPMIHLMKQAVQAVDVERGTVAKRLKDFVLQKFESRFGSVERVHMLAGATLLDPRYKKLHFSSPLALAETINLVAAAVKEEMRKTSFNASGHSNVVPQQQLLANPSDPEDLWGLHDELVYTSEANREEDNAGGLPVELRHFLNRPLIDRKANPFKAWQVMKSEYPHTFKVAMKYLPAISSSVPTERLFSGAGLIMTDHRNRLTPDHLSRLLFLSCLDQSKWNE